MYHHSTADYKVAKSEAATKGRQKMEAMIEKGRASAVSVIEQVQNQVPQDYIAPSKAIAFVNNGRRVELQMPEHAWDKGFPLHRNALGQIAGKLGIGMQALNYYNNLSSPVQGKDTIQHGDWAAELLAHNLTTLMAHNTERNLIRTVNGEARGFLSDKYRRLDSRPLVEAFASACREIGALPIEGYALDTKVHLRAVLPMIFEPIKDEVQLFGLDWHNSDFGNGAHGVSFWNMRVWCTNTAMMEELLRQVHLGARLGNDIAYSDRTMQLDTAANASALTDIVKTQLSPERINKCLQMIIDADAEKMTADKARNLLSAAKVGKGDTERITEAYTGADIEMLPAGNSLYRLSSAVSWVANNTEDAERKIELQGIAGDIMKKVSK